MTKGEILQIEMKESDKRDGHTRCWMHLSLRRGNDKSALCVTSSILHCLHQCPHEAETVPSHSTRSPELSLPRHVRPFNSSIDGSMAKPNKDTKNITHLSATLDIFSRCRSNCNCQKVIWNHSKGQLANTVYNYTSRWLHWLCVHP